MYKNLSIYFKSDGGRFIGSPKQINDRQFLGYMKCILGCRAITISGTSPQTQKGN